MSRDGRLSGVLHLVLHLLQRGEPQTSEVLAQAMNTNSVVVRRLLGSLRRRGLVRSTKGHGGGWEFARDPRQVTLRDVYRALGDPPLLAIGNRADDAGCAVEAAVNASLGRSFEQAEALLLTRFSKTTLAQLSRDVHRHSVRKKFKHHHVRVASRRTSRRLRA